jgi:hypothetical protein
VSDETTAGAEEDFRALDPFFRIIEGGLRGYTDDEHFFDLLAEDVVFDFVITVPGYPRHVVGRDNLIELFRGYGRSFFLDSCDDLRVNGRSRVLLARHCRRHRLPVQQQVHLRHHDQGPQDRGVA